MSLRTLPTLASRDLRVVVVSLLVAAHLGEGLEPALQGFAPDRLVRLVGAVAGWSAVFAATLAFLALGFFVVRGALNARASWARSVLTGSTAAAAAFALTAVVSGHAGPSARVLLAAITLALLSVRALTQPTFVRMVPAIAVAASAVAHDLAQRAFEHGGVAYWLAARGFATVAALGSLALLVALVQRVARVRKDVALGAFVVVALLTWLVARGAGTFEVSLPALAHRAVVRGSGSVPPFGLGALPLLGPSVARLFAWAAVAVLPASSLGLALLCAFTSSLPAPLAALAVLLACHVDAAGGDAGDDDARAL